LTKFSWTAGVQLDFKGRHVQAQAVLVHTSVVDTLQAFVAKGEVIWPDLTHYSDDVILTGALGQQARYLTAFKGSTNATPPGDTLSRGTFLELLVAQGLAEPCDPQYAPTAPQTAVANDVGQGLNVGLTPYFLNFGPGVEPIDQFAKLPIPLPMP
jgi:hypothetical protein